MKPNKKFIAIIIALLVAAGAATYITQQEEPVEPTMSEIEVPVEQPVETPTETPVEGDTAVEGQPAADETTATGNLGGSVGENNFGMTNLMDSIKDNNQTDVEHSLDLEEQKQEQSQSSSGNGSSVGSDVGSGNGSGSAGTGSNGSGNGTGTGNSSVGGGSVGEGNNIPTQNPDGTLDASNVKPQTPVDQESLRQEVESKESTEKVLGYNAEVGGVYIQTDLGYYATVLPGGAVLEDEFLDILKQFNK